MMKKLFLSAGVAILVSGAFIRPASAQIKTICSTCAQESSEVVRWATQLQRMASELEALKAEASADFDEVSNLRNIGNGFSNGSFDGVTSRLQQGAYTFDQVNTSPTLLQNDYKNLGNQYSDLTQTLGRRSDQISSDADTMRSLKSTAETSVGTHGAMMVSNQIQAQRALQELNAEQANTQALSTMAAAQQVVAEHDALSDADHNRKIVNPAQYTIPEND